MQIQYSAREVASILSEVTGEVPCDFCGNDEWLPYCCDYGEDCTGVHDLIECWMQYLKHLPEKGKVLAEQDDWLYSDDFACDECKGYGDDYFFDDDGELVSNCDGCIHNNWRETDD